MLKIDVGHLINSPVGSREEFDLDEMAHFDEKDSLRLKKNIKAEVKLLKLPHEINIQIYDLNTSIETACVRCLKIFDYIIYIPFAEREFIIDLPKRDLETGEDVYYVDKATNEIDLNGMLREEVLLHFSEVRVCSPLCRGLCVKCGMNLNNQSCNCHGQEKPTITPFKFLLS